jgi:hypothetical protein
MEGSPIENGIVFSTWFAGKWYRLVQHKHHRWKMDARQIEQYHIGTALHPKTKRGKKSGAKAKGEPMVWWEGFKVQRRQLSFLAPNAWLNLCPLVCEDLAQFEPVSEVIRGVGPTLLIALLLDGPQLEVRWPSRYATVLAADPGSAVLTLTCLGMAERSRRRRSDPLNRVIALRRDADGPLEIKLHKNAHAVMLKVEGEFAEEFTADGRSDRGGAARFRLPRTDGRYTPEQVRLKRRRKRRARRPRGRHDTPDEASTFTDMRELATATFLIDVALEVDDDVLDTLERWAQGHRSDVPLRHDRGAALVEVFEEVLAHQVPDRRFWTGRGRPEGIARDMRFAVTVFTALAREARDGSRGRMHDRTAWWSRVLDMAGQWLADERRVGGSFFGPPRDERRRIERAIPQAVAWAVHNRLIGAHAEGRTEAARTKAHGEIARAEEVVRRGKAMEGGDGSAHRPSP